MTNSVSGQKHILVVDDERFVCDSIKMMLEFEGHKVETARSGKEALELVRNHAFDLVFTDQEMPMMKGSELAVRVKEQNPKLPVIMVTAYMETLPKNLPGVDHMIGKPFLLEDLRKAIATFSPPSTNK